MEKSEETNEEDLVLRLWRRTFFAALLSFGTASLFVDCSGSNTELCRECGVDTSITVTWPTNSASSPKKVGWAVLIEGTCVTGGTMSFTGARAATCTDTQKRTGCTQTTVSCTTGTFEALVDLTSLPVGTQTLPVIETIASTGYTYQTSFYLQRDSTDCDTETARDNTYAAGLAGGGGTALSPYKICSAFELDEVRNAVGTNEYFVLKNDIDLSPYTANSFVYLPNLGGGGEFDGNSMLIHSWTYDAGADDWVGLFSTATHDIKNLYIERFTLASSQDRLGLLVGFVSGAGGTIDNVHVSNSTITHEGSDTGGIVGFNWGTISNSSVSNVTFVLIGATSFVGGILGNWNTGPVVMSGCHATGNTYNFTAATGGSYVGGLAGQVGNNTISDSWADVNFDFGTQTRTGIGGITGLNGAGTILRSYASGTITGSSSLGRVGGLAGLNGFTTPSNGTISQSYANITIAANDGVGPDRVGGLVGWHMATSAIIDSYARGTIRGDDSVGGLVGYFQTTATIATSYSAVVVTGNTNTGAFVGLSPSTGSCTGFFDADIDGLAGTSDGTTTCTAGGVVGKSTSNLQTQGTFIGWDFATPIWKFFTSGSYPVLEWQTQ